jgi:hypothetical protein
MLDTSVWLFSQDPSSGPVGGLGTERDERVNEETWVRKPTVKKFPVNGLETSEKGWFLEF